MSSSGDRKITLKSLDGQTFQVEEAAALQSVTLMHSMGGDWTMKEITVSKVTGKILAKVIDYCRRHAAAATKAEDGGAASSSNTSAVDGDLKKFDANFVNVDQTTLFDLIMAANYLKIHSLLDLTCQKVAAMLKGKTAEQIREEFHIKKDFTAEDEAEARRENAWAFE